MFQFAKMIKLSTHKIVMKLSKIWVIPDPGVKTAPDPESGIRNTATSQFQYCIVHRTDLMFDCRPSFTNLAKFSAIIVVPMVAFYYVTFGPSW